MRKLAQENESNTVEGEKVKTKKDPGPERGASKCNGCGRGRGWLYVLQLDMSIKTGIMRQDRKALDDVNTMCKRETIWRREEAVQLFRGVS